MTDIFISYASADRPSVKPLVDALQQQGWSVWWDRTILAGKTFDRVIEAALKDSRCVIVLWSKDSVDSDWVWTEADEGKRRGILVPALLDNVDIPLAFRRIHTANLIGWSGALPSDQFDELTRAVSDVLSNIGIPAVARPEQENKQTAQQVRLEQERNRAAEKPRLKYEERDRLENESKERAEQERLEREKQAQVQAEHEKPEQEPKSRTAEIGQMAERVVDAAIPSRVVKDQATELLVLVRLPESVGLAGVLAADDDAEVQPEDVRSKPFACRFPLRPGWQSARPSNQSQAYLSRFLTTTANEEYIGAARR